MLINKLSSNIKVITIILVTVMLTGCGGGRATSTTSSDSTGSATLSWFPPTSYSDGSDLANLAGHNIYVNAGEGYVKVTTIDNPGVSTYVVENLPFGTYTFAVTAFDDQGVESSFSNEASITINS